MQVVNPHLRPHCRLCIQARILLSPIDSRHPPHLIRRLPHAVRHHHRRHPGHHHGLFSLGIVRSTVGTDRDGHAQEINGALEPVRDHLLARTAHGCCPRGCQLGSRGVEHSLAFGFL